MIKDKKILAVITARGGSKGLVGKNIKKLNNIPLINYSIEACLKSKYIDKAILSTDDENIIRVAKLTGIEIPFIRPKELASDTATSISVIQHAVAFLENIGDKYDYIITIQPTSPLRTEKHLDEAIELISSNNEADSLLSVTEVGYHPYWMKKIEKGYLTPFYNIDEKTYTRRQDLPKVYQMNGAIFISTRDLIMKNNVISGHSVIPYLMTNEDSIDIDNQIDFNLVELLIKSRSIE